MNLMNRILATTALFSAAACGGAGEEGGILGGSVSLKAEPVSATAIRLTWSKPSGGVTTSLYVVRRNDEQSTASVSSTSERTYTVMGLAPATRYCFEIKSPLLGLVRSNTACATTLADTSAPTVPGGLSVTAISPAEVSLTWNFASDDHRVREYNVFRDGTLLLSSSAVAVTDNGAIPAANHCYRVSAVDPAGNESPKSPEVCVSMPEDMEDPSAPAGLRAEFSASDGQPEIKVTWIASTDDGVVSFYRVYRDDVYIGDAADTVYQDQDLQPEAYYCYTVAAVDSAGNESTRSNEACARESWAQTALGTFDALGSAIAVDSAGNPHIAHKSRKYNAATREVRIELGFTTIGPSGVPATKLLEEGLETYFFADFPLDAVIDDSGQLHIAHKFNHPSLAEEIQHLQVTPGSILRHTIDQNENNLWAISLALDSTGVIHACYDDGSTLFYANNSSGVWTATNADSLVAGTAGNHCAIAIDSNDKVHIAFLESYSKNLQYLSNFDGNWALVTLDQHSGAINTSHHTSIAVDADNHVHVAYFHDYADNDLEYATNSTGVWETHRIDTEGNVGRDCDIAVDPDGFVHIVYQDHTAAKLLKYASNRSGAWESVILANAATGSSTIAIDSSGNVHIAFLDADGELSYVTNRD